MCGSSQSIHELSMQRLCCQLVCSFCFQSLESRELHLVLADNLYHTDSMLYETAVHRTLPEINDEDTRTKVLDAWLLHCEGDAVCSAIKQCGSQGVLLIEVCRLTILALINDMSLASALANKCCRNSLRSSNQRD